MSGFPDLLGKTGVEWGRGIGLISLYIPLYHNREKKDLPYITLDDK